MSLVYLYRGSMHVVELRDDLFSWKKYDNYMHINIVWKVRIRHKGCFFERDNELYMQKYNVLTRLTEYDPYE
jgi:hypothetical protein